MIAMQKIIKLINCALAIFIKFSSKLQPVILLVARLVVAQVFWLSGLQKISNFDNTLALFQTEYAVPLLPPFIAAIMATFFELTCSVLLALGLAGRLATLPLLVMTAVIQFTYDQNVQHTYWALLLGTILAFGPGKFSCDYFIGRKFWKVYK